MKWFFAILCVIAGGLIGYLLRAGKKRRSQILNDLSAMCDIIDKNIGFTHDKVRTILQEIRGKVGKEVSAFLGVFEQNLGAAQLQAELYRACAKLSLKKEETDTVVGLLTAFGKTDAVSQREMLAVKKKELDQYCVSAQEDYKKNAKLYLELGVLLGIGVGILLL